MFLLCYYSNEVSRPTNTSEIDYDLCLPPELMEKIVCYLDGRTLLQFKLLSKTCTDIANNALRYNKLWKRICLKEIPKRYFIILLSKHCDTFTPLDSLTESQYEELYKSWILWQSTVLNVTCIGQHNFLDNGMVKNVICNKRDVMLVLSNGTTKFSLLKNQKTTNSYTVKDNTFEPNLPYTLTTLNPWPQISEVNNEPDLFITCCQKYSNVCPLHNTGRKIHDGSLSRYYIGKLIDVDTSVYTNVCCWVRSLWYEWHSNDTPDIVNGHYCQKLHNTIFTSVIHGLIVSQTPTNCIVVHEMFNNTCITLCPWMDHKYIEATALYIYTDILFIGTQNSYLLAYRLRCWDDLFNLKHENMFLEMQLGLGQIIKINIMDYKDIKAIVVASKSSICWLKVN